MTSASPTSSRGYLDFQGLASLRGDAARDPDKAVRATAEQFEAYFIQQMTKAMRDTVEKSDMVEQGNMDMYQDLMDKEVSLQMVRRGGVGLADMLEKQLLQQQALAQVSAQEALRSRAVAAPSSLPLQAPKVALPLTKDSGEMLLLQKPGPLALPTRPGDKP